MKIRVLIVCFLFLSFLGYAQNKKIYVFNDMYPTSIKNFIKSNGTKFSDIKIMTNNMLLSGKNIDYKKVKENLTTLFPSKNANGILCIDLENQSYDHLKGNNITRMKKVSVSQYKKAEEEFIRLIRFVKNERPNLKVGFYGMPFKAYYEAENRAKYSKALDNILKEVDVIFPSFYLPNLASQSSMEQNKTFLRGNLNTSLTYGARLKKPVLPFFWYLTFSPDLKTRYELIPKNELEIYMEYILSYTFNGNEVDGIVWWDSSTPFYKKNKGMIKQSQVRLQNVTSEPELKQTDVFLYYFK